MGVGLGAREGTAGEVGGSEAGPRPGMLRQGGTGQGKQMLSQLLPHLTGREPPTSLSDFCPSLGTPNPLGLPGT